MRISDWSSDVCSSDLQRCDQRLDFGGVDPFAARFDKVLGAARDRQIARPVDQGKVARVEPSRGVGRGLPLAEIAFDDSTAADAQMAFGPALLGQARQSVV